MHALVAFGVKLLEALFFTGIIGSALVVLLTGIEDLRMMLSRDGKEQ